MQTLDFHVQVNVLIVDDRVLEFDVVHGYVLALYVSEKYINGRKWPGHVDIGKLIGK